MMKRKHWIYESIDTSKHEPQELPHVCHETTESVEGMSKLIRTSGLSSEEEAAMDAYIHSANNLSIAECIEFLRNYYYDRNEEKE